MATQAPYHPGRGQIATQRGNTALREWWLFHGTAYVKNVCDRAGIGFDHFTHVAAGRRRLSIDAAAKFLKAAESRQPAPSFEALRPPKSTTTE